MFSENISSSPHLIHTPINEIQQNAHPDSHAPVAQIERRCGNLDLEMDTIPSGKSTVAFPMDYRLKVEAWVADQPLILSGNLDEGKVIIDGDIRVFTAINVRKSPIRCGRRLSLF